jgi:parvulin-like peptidyl-prolyl isomerase
MAKGQKGQLVTKKHLARQERERRQNRIILLVSLAVIVVVVGLISYGIIQQYIIQPQQPVAKVANDVITTKQFQTFARYERLQIIQQYQQYEQYAQLFSNDQNSLSYIQSYMAQISNQLEPETLGQNTLDYLIANRIIEKEAEKRGITVSDEEIKKSLQDYFGYFPDGTPTSAPTSMAVPTSTLNPTQYLLVSPTATATPAATNTPAPTITVTLEIASPTPTAVITPTTPAPTSTPLPTPTPYTESAYKKDFKSYMTNINTFASLSEADFRWVTKMQLLRQKVYDAITADIPMEQDQVWARHIVVSDQTQAQSLYDDLNSGGDFVAIATAVYSGTTNTVDLGWFGTGTLDVNAEKIVFNLQIGQISEPIQTPSGWEIYQILGHEVRTLSDSQFQQLKQTEFQNWVDQQKLQKMYRRLIFGKPGCLPAQVFHPLKHPNNPISPIIEINILSIKNSQCEKVTSTNHTVNYFNTWGILI